MENSEQPGGSALTYPRDRCGARPRSGGRSARRFWARRLRPSIPKSSRSPLRLQALGGALRPGKCSGVALGQLVACGSGFSPTAPSRFSYNGVGRASARRQPLGLPAARSRAEARPTNLSAAPMQEDPGPGVARSQVPSRDPPARMGRRSRPPSDSLHPHRYRSTTVHPSSSSDPRAESPGNDQGRGRLRTPHRNIGVPH